MKYVDAYLDIPTLKDVKTNGKQQNVECYVEANAKVLCTKRQEMAYNSKERNLTLTERFFRLS